MHGWKGSEIALLRKGSTTLMVYTYETFEAETRTSPDKVGLVVAGMLDGGNEFRGVFHDVSVSEPGKTLRSGSVRLICERN